MNQPLLVDATDLAFWANRRDAQALLPRLVRRLIHATVDHPKRICFRAGEGVQLGGWDGIVEIEQGNAFVPDGLSAWELSVEKKVKAKADSDYEKRCADPFGVDQSNATFVFVTARKWGGKDAWVTERNKEGTWREVRAYDADDMEAWLETAPPVHTWISILLGKHPEGARDVDGYWNDWSKATDPETSPDLVLAGRKPTLEAVHSWLVNPATPLTLRGESRAESLAVLAASIQKLEPDERERVLSRTVIVRDLATWRRLTASESRLLLVQDFEGAETIGSAMQKGHAPVVLLGHADSASSNAVQIPRCSREEAARALLTMGLPSDKVGELATLARRSLISLHRRTSIVPEIEQPKWARPENAHLLLPALLAGRWSADTEGDREILATISGTSYEAVNTTCVRWLNEDDPPVRCVGTIWYLTSEEDAWSLLGRYLTTDDLDRFSQVAVGVLKRADPSFDLPDDQRWMAGVIGPRPEHSAVLRTGIANTLAIMGAKGEAIRVTGDLTIEGCAGLCVRNVLDTDDWKVWASFPLTVLAEAAPDEFLAAVDRGLSGDHPVLRGLFGDQEDDLFSSPAHIGLLFALETLAWSEGHLVRSATALAKLARIDPDGKWANRPLASLRSIFLLWSPQTTAPPEKRFSAIDAIRQRLPEIAWKVMNSLLPQHMDHQNRTARPRWRDWIPEDDVRVTTIEHAKAVNELIVRLLEDVGADGTRWSDLIDALPQLPRDGYDLVVMRLESLDAEEMQPAGLASIWNGFRTLISQHRSHPDADWSLPKDEVDRLADLLSRFEPEEPLARFGWLFGNRPALPEGREADWESYESAIAARQCGAVQTLYDTRALHWVAEFVENVDRPDQLGAAFARSVVAGQVGDVLLHEHLRPDDIRYHRFVAGFINQKVRACGLDWAREKLASLASAWSPKQRAAFCVSLPFETATWEIVEGLGQPVSREYWATVSPAYVDEVDVEVAARHLLECDRPHIAVGLLQLRIRSSKLSATLLVETLESLLRCPKNELDERRLSAHDVSELLEVASTSPDVDESRIAALEWGFLPAFGRRQHTPRLLLRELARSPEFFAQVVALVFRAEGEESRELSEEEQARWTRAYELLETWRWRPLPGMPEDGAFDAEGLRNWVVKAREILQADGRLAMCDHTIGQVLSGSPGGDDSIWPHPAVRDLIEELESDDFEQGLMIGLLNSEGVTWRDPKEGGSREQSAADRYEQWARAVCHRRGRTAAMLRRMQDSYQARARHEDQRAELREDLSP